MTAETVSEKLDRISRQGYPTTASVEVTAGCNARCEYCYVRDGSFKELSTERLCFALNKLSESGVFHLHLTGGEPFLRQDILALLSFAFKHGIFHCTLFSNGILLNDEHRAFLIQNRDFIRNMQLSVFSHVPSINDRYFGVPGAFEVIVKNALHLKENGIKVSIAMTVMDFNIDALEETRRFFEDRDLPLLLAYFKIINGPRIEKLLAASTTYSFFKRYLQSMRPEELGKFKQDMKESLDLPPQNNADLCHGRWNTVFMNAQGDLAPCISFRNVIFGNIFEERSLHDILQDAPDYHSICALKKNDMKKCAACKFYNFCTICIGTIHTERRSFCEVDLQMCNFAQALYDILD